MSLLKRPILGLPPPDRVYNLSNQIEGDIIRVIPIIFWEHLMSSYDILLAESDWPLSFVYGAPKGDEVILPSFSRHAPMDVAKTNAAEWALALAPAVYRNQVGWDVDSPSHLNPLRSEPSPQAQYPIKRKTKASVRDIMTQSEYQGVIEDCVSDMNNPLFPILKPDRSYRIVFDYRHLRCKIHTVLL